MIDGFLSACLCSLQIVNSSPLARYAIITTLVVSVAAETVMKYLCHNKQSQKCKQLFATRPGSG